MTIPILTAELAAKIEQADFATMYERMLAMQSKPGNPTEVEIRKFGNATALLARKLPFRDFNRVYGFTENDISQLVEIKKFYMQQPIKLEFGIDIVPHDSRRELLEAFAAAGFQQSGFHTSLYGYATDAPIAVPPFATAREITEGEIPLFEQVFIDALELPFSDRTQLPENIPYLFNDPNWKLYLGYVEQQPAGFALLHSADGIASLALAGTIPAFRGKGCQAALLNERILQAKRSGYSLLVAQTKFGSVSMRNLQRCGMRIAFTKSEWTYYGR